MFRTPKNSGYFIRNCRVDRYFLHPLFNHSAFKIIGRPTRFRIGRFKVVLFFHGMKFIDEHPFVTTAMAIKHAIIISPTAVIPCFSIRLSSFIVSGFQISFQTFRMKWILLQHQDRVNREALSDHQDHRIGSLGRVMPAGPVHHLQV